MKTRFWILLFLSIAVVCAGLSIWLLSERIDACESLIFGYAGETFNLNSTRQLGVFLFETLGLPPVKKTKSGYSTNAEVLEKLRDRHPAVQAIMDYRMLTKLDRHDRAWPCRFAAFRHGLDHRNHGRGNQPLCLFLAALLSRG